MHMATEQGHTTNFTLRHDGGNAMSYFKTDLSVHAN